MWCGHKSGKRAVLLAVILSLGLTACGSREKEKESRLPGTVYVPKFTELKLAAEGKSVTFISSEIDEMLRTCSRLIVMRDRKAVGELNGNDLTQSKIMATIAGGDEK